MDQKKSILPYIGILLVFLSSMYFILPWQGYYDSFTKFVPDTPYQIYLTLFISFTAFILVFLSAWSIYLGFSITSRKENKAWKPMLIPLVLIGLSIIVTAIYRWHGAIYREGIEVSWYRYYSQSHHFNFISHWIHLFILPLLILAIGISLTYFCSCPKQKSTMASFALFGSIGLLIVWCVLLNHFTWSGNLQSSIYYKLMSERIPHPNLYYQITYYYNPFRIIETFIRSIQDYFTISSTFPNENLRQVFTFRLDPTPTLINIKPSVTVMFYVRMAIIWTVTVFISLIHRELSQSLIEKSSSKD